jgi:hypothetical protein
MASWGRGADVSLTGTGDITIGTNTVVGTGTLFTTELEVGNIISLSTSVFKVTAIASDTSLTVEPAAAGSLATAALLGSESPKYLPVSEINNITYVATGDISANTRIDGVKTPGWTLYEEYGTGRKRVEILVAMKTTT